MLFGQKKLEVKMKRGQVLSTIVTLIPKNYPLANTALLQACPY